MSSAPVCVLANHIQARARQRTFRLRANSYCSINTLLALYNSSTLSASSNITSGISTWSLRLCCLYRSHWLTFCVSRADSLPSYSAYQAQGCSLLVITPFLAQVRRPSVPLTVALPLRFNPSSDSDYYPLIFLWGPKWRGTGLVAAYLPLQW